MGSEPVYIACLVAISSLSDDDSFTDPLLGISPSKILGLKHRHLAPTVGQIAVAPLLDLMVTIRAVAGFEKFNEGAMITFGSWTAVADWDGELHWYLTDDIAPDSNADEPPTLAAMPPQQATERSAPRVARANPDTISGSYPTRRSI